MRRTAIIVMLLVGGLVGLLALSAEAQTIPPIPVQPGMCYVPEYDLTGDGRVDINDFNLWKMAVLRSTTACGLGASAEACPLGYDIDGNGVIELEDLHEMVLHYKYCIRGPRTTDPVR